MYYSGVKQLSIMTRLRLTARWGFWPGEIIGTCFFQNDVGNTVVDNGQQFRSTITDFL